MHSYVLHSLRVNSTVGSLHRWDRSYIDLT